MAIYTKKGDDGKTKILGSSKRLLKSAEIIKTLGAIDEANSYLGLTISTAKNKELRNQIFKIQKDLFVIGAILGGAKIKWQGRRVKELEKEIDRLEKELPLLSRFILAGGSLVATQLMYARTLVRKAEREIVGLSNRTKFRNKREILVYINRLSDALFMLARQENFRQKFKEIIWTPEK